MKSGIAWLQPYFDDGKLAFMRIPSAELVPIWRDAERTKLDAFIRFYDQVIYIGTRKHTITHAELWWTGGVKYFKTDAFAGTIAGDFIVDTEHGDETNDYTEPHFTVGNKAYNWDTVPIVWLKYNEEELPLCYFIKDLIDDINWQTSVTADVLRDVAKFIYILKNYGGQDLGEFIKDLKEHMAIKVTTDGGVDKLQADLNIDAVMAFLDKQRRDVYDFAAAVDTKDPDLGNASGTAINFRYMDLSSDCDSLATELKDTFQRLKLFIDVYLQIAGQGRLFEGNLRHRLQHGPSRQRNRRNPERRRQRKPSVEADDPSEPPLGDGRRRRNGADRRGEEGRYGGIRRRPVRRRPGRRQGPERPGRPREWRWSRWQRITVTTGPNAP